MTVRDRLRAIDQAAAGVMRPVRPLDLPLVPAPARRPRWVTTPPRSRGWLVPLTAAAVVAALAVTLVSIKQAWQHGGRPGTSPVTGPSAQAPRYYVALTQGSSSGLVVSRAIVADSRTGAVLATVNAPAHSFFVSVTGAADDRTFVLDTMPNGSVNPAASRWYELTIAPGTGQPALLAPLPITGLPDSAQLLSHASAQVLGLALSPDARTLAVLSGNALRTYSLATGKTLHTWWTTSKATISQPTGYVNAASLSWTADGRTLAFRYPPQIDLFRNPPARDYLRTLPAASKNGDLLKASTPVLADPAGRDMCVGLRLGTDGRTAVCSTGVFTSRGCAQAAPEFDLYSTVTGKLTRVLYRYLGNCTSANTAILWAGPDGTAIGLIVAAHHDGSDTSTVGLLTHGLFVPLNVSRAQDILGERFAF
jgi:hypothetical protein